MKNGLKTTLTLLGAATLAISFAGCSHNDAPAAAPTTVTQAVGGKVSAADQSAEQSGVKASMANASAAQAQGAAASAAAGAAMKGPGPSGQ
jgi:hypothetical protein